MGLCAAAFFLALRRPCNLRLHCMVGLHGELASGKAAPVSSRCARAVEIYRAGEVSDRLRLRMWHSRVLAPGLRPAAESPLAEYGRSPWTDAGEYHLKVARTHSQ